MKTGCKAYLEDIASLALGAEDVAGLAHIETCAACGAMLQEMRNVVAAGRRPVYEAPTDVIARAQSLMQPTSTPVFARLIGSSLAASGARTGDADSFQLVFETPEGRTRIRYAREGNAWEVIGHTEPSDNELYLGRKRIETDEIGRFSFKAKKLESTGIRVLRNHREVLIPPAKEVLDRGAEGFD